MKVYTKTGDNGTTSLIGGKRVSKCDWHLEVYGTLDELDSFIGLLKNEVSDDGVKSDLLKIQEIISKVNICFAYPDATPLPAYEFKTENTAWLEGKIDEYGENLSPIENFLIPGSNRVNALANICRTVCRRAERAAYKNKLTDNQQYAAIFINRLSDYFFVLGRRIG